MPNLITTATQMRDLVSLFGDKKFIYDGPVLKGLDGRSSKQKALKDFMSPITAGFLTNEQLNELTAKSSKFVELANQKREAMRRNSYTNIDMGYNFDFEIDHPVETWQVLVHIQLQHDAYDSTFSFSADVELCTNFRQYNRQRIILNDFNTFAISENELLEVFADSKTKISETINNLYESALQELTPEGYYEKYNIEIDCSGINRRVSNYASLSKFIDRDF